MEYQGRRAAYTGWLALLLAGCVVAPSTPYYADEAITVAPPPPQVEYVGPPPVVGNVWIGGYWNWGPQHRYTWVPGYWTAPRPGYRWAPYRWAPDGPRWRQYPGHWARG